MNIHRQFLRAIAAVLVLGTLCLAQPSEASSEGYLRKTLENYLTAPVLRPGEDRRYSSAFVDLRDNGNLEAIVYLTDGSWCGSGGCTTLVLAPKDSEYELVTKITITRRPIRVLNSKTNGWHDLSVVVGGGGISPYEAKLSFDGKTYPSNPSMPPALRLDTEIAGKMVLAPQSQRPGNGPAEKEVEQVLRAQQDAWNRHDLDAFMAGYWNSPELTFFSGANQKAGWQETMDRYRARYQSRGHEMGRLEFSELRIEMLGDDAAFVRGAWHLTMADGKTPHGLFTLVFRRFGDGWKIVHDHTSAAD
jgi:ketosteroid isomerase-like protein